MTPFGSLIPTRTGSSSSYRYGFNGKEKDDEIKGEANSLDFGARMYDPRVGRWFAPDPLEADFPYVSPYVYSLNNPLFYIDSDGRKPDPIFVKFLQTAINNVPKMAAYNKYNELASFAYKNDYHKKSIEKFRVSLVHDKKYIYKKDNNILKDNTIYDNSNLNFNGIELNITYFYTKKVSMDLFSVYSLDFKLGKNGKPHVYGGTGIANGMGGGSGYFLELENSSNTYGIPSSLIKFKNLDEANKAKNQIDSVFDKTFHDLINKDPLVKMYHNLQLEYKDLNLLIVKLNNDPKNKELIKKYDQAEKKYLKNNNEFLKQQEKAIEYDKKEFKNKN